ncbi:c-type cytochrome [Halomonas dongshanensis]|uniref:C-type cytochrome n=1 Tax=Halomonas dongshanensis TaxID=2890835 RepID=A0ABT2E971_9GAMM|nr:c-type cytochrome [Halomonas dongshanensis]MCS2608114.1 c-type cytochrome [Halomonas dongshanensis]
MLEPTAKPALPIELAGTRFGVVMRPPHYRWDGERLICSRLRQVDDSALAGLEEVRVVVDEDFVGVVAPTIEAARNAAKRVVLTWDEPPAAKAATRSPKAKLTNTSSAAKRDTHTQTYAWPSRLRWGDAPGWVVARADQASLEVWAPTATPEALRVDLSLATGCDAERIVLRDPSGLGFATGLGRHCGDDAAVDAALLAQAVGAPVAVWLDADYARDVRALGRAQCMTLGASLDAAHVTRFRYRQAHAQGEVAAVGLLLCGREAPTRHGDTDRADLYSPYRFEQTHVSAHRGARAYQNDDSTSIQHTFARESFLDELAHAEGVDPLALRQRHLEDARGLELIGSVASQADWAVPVTEPPVGDVMRGRGLAYAQLPDRHQRLDGGVRSAWIADVEVNRTTGDVRLTRLVVGQDSGEQVDTARLQQTLQARVLSKPQGLLGRTPAFDEWDDGRTTAVERASFTPAPAPISKGVETLPERFDDTDFAPGVAVIANALFDATGVRFREPPFTAGRVRQALAMGEAFDGDDATAQRGTRKTSAKLSGTRRWWAAAALTTVAGGAVMAWPFKGAIAPIARPAATLYSAETIERGRLVAAAGDCAACHTVAGGAVNTGGHAFETPFGTLYSTNITPDEATGIGNWSYAAFERAMRHGISRDGRHLYPAFPYTAFAKTSDADLQALYAYLMAQPAVAAPAPENALTFPFNLRALMAPWNALYHDPTPFVPNPAQSDLYNRGAYLAEGLGHCSACHSPRNAMGAEQGGERYFAGALVDGWEAPPLNALSRSPVPWSENALFDYLRHGSSPLHGVASGPMAPVVAGLAELPEYDVRAIAHYVAQQMGAPVEDEPAQYAQAAQLAASSAASPSGQEEGARLFEGACAACHLDNGVPAFTKASTALALNTNLYSERPDNVIHSILGGVHDDAVPGSGSMPGFADSFSDTQVATLAAYLRARFAPSEPPWQQLEQRVAALRQPHNNTPSTP